MNYANNNNIYKSYSSWNINDKFDTDAVFDINGKSYNLNYRDKTGGNGLHQADYGDLTQGDERLINSDGTFNVAYLENHTAYFEGDGPLNGKPLAVGMVNGQKTVCVRGANGKLYPLDQIMSGKRLPDGAL